MSYRLARFPLTSRRLREGREQRKKKQAKRFRFSHFTEKERVPMFVNQIGERYSQADLKKFFGIQLPVPHKMRSKR